MQFAYTEYSWVLLSLPAVILLLYWRSTLRQKRLEAFADAQLLPALDPDFKQYRLRAFTKAALYALITFCLSLTILRPQWGFEWKESKRKGVDIVVTVDVSQSMLASDIAPSRLERAKRELLDLLDHLEGDRIALVAFAGVAFIESPLTIDYGTFRLFLKSIQPDLIPVPGTNIELALKKSISAFITKNSEQSKRERAIILITDGEELDGDFSSVAQKAAEENIQIFIIGIGTEEGSPISMRGGYKKNNDGQVVISKLNQKALENLALETGGVYAKSISSEKDTVAIYDLGIKKKLEESAIEGSRAKRWNEHFQIPLFIALILFIILPLIERSPGEVFSLFKRSFRRRAIRDTALGLMIAALAMNPATAQAEDSERIGKNALQKYQESKFEESLKEFERGKELSPEDARFYLGRGANHYRLKNYKDAVQAFHEAAAKALAAEQKARALYNAANGLTQLGQCKHAVETFEESLKLAPRDKEARENLAYVKDLLESGDQEHCKDQNKQQKDKKQQDKQQKEEQEQQQNEEEPPPPDKQEEKEESQDKQQQEQEEEEKKQQQQQQKEQEEQKEQQEQEQQQSQPQPQAGENGSQDQEQLEPGDGENEASYDQLESLLGNIEENRAELMEYRKQQAIKELKKERRRMPIRDW